MKIGSNTYLKYNSLKVKPTDEVEKVNPTTILTY